MMKHLKEVLGTRCSVTVYMILLNIFGTLVDMMSFLVAPNVVGKSDERKGLISSVYSKRPKRF